jgi:hypothetical protein
MIIRPTRPDLRPLPFGYLAIDICGVLEHEHPTIYVLRGCNRRGWLGAESMYMVILESIVGGVVFD